MFARLLRALRDAGRRPTLKADGPRLRAWGQARLDALAQELPPPSPEVQAREAQEFLEDLDTFLEAECAGAHGVDPVGFEVAFGQSGDDEPLSSADALVVDLGGGRRLHLHGSIDRINRLGPGRYEVADYKTGGYYADGWKGAFAGGTRLQHAVYGLAAARLLRPTDPKARVVNGVYLFPSTRAHGRRKDIPAPSTGTIGEVLAGIVETLGAGAFSLADSAEACRWCALAPACRPGQDDEKGRDEVIARTQEKWDSAENTVLEPLRRLRSHE